MKSKDAPTKKTSRRSTEKEAGTRAPNKTPNKTPSNVLALPPRPLSLKEKNVLEFLEEYMSEKGISPSYQEICDHFGFASFNSAQRYLKQLEQKGYLNLPGPNQKRAITILRSSSSVQDALDEMQHQHKEVTPLPSQIASENFSLPLLGRVAAGAPIERMEHDEFIDVPASLVRHADRTYALRVEGQSMIDDGILDGDVILVQKQSYATNGEIIVAMVGDEATVKRYYLHSSDRSPNYAKSDQSTEKRATNKSFNKPVSSSGKTVELRPANSEMASMWFNPGEVQIRGVVVGLIRRFW